jgi:hypothetical protein
MMILMKMSTNRDMQLGLANKCTPHCVAQAFANLPWPSLTGPTWTSFYENCGCHKLWSDVLPERYASLHRHCPSIDILT